MDIQIVIILTRIERVVSIIMGYWKIPYVESGGFNNFNQAEENNTCFIAINVDVIWWESRGIANYWWTAAE